MGVRRVVDYIQPSGEGIGPGNVFSGGTGPGPFTQAEFQEPYDCVVVDESGDSAELVAIANPSVAITGANRVGGALAPAGTYRYQYSAIGAYGETLAGGESAALTIGAAGTQAETLTLTQIAGAAYYRIWRTLTTGASATEVYAFSVIAPSSVAAGSTFTVVDFGPEAQAFGTAGTNIILPIVNTTNPITALVNPSVAVTGVAGAQAGATLAAGTYFYSYTAVNAYGETTKGTSISAGVVVTLNQKVTLTISAITGAYYYKIYRTAPGGAAGTEVYLMTVPAALLAPVDDGNYVPIVTLAGTTPPTANTTGPGQISLGKLAVKVLGSTNVVGAGTLTGGRIGGHAYAVGLVAGQRLAPFTYGVVRRLANTTLISPQGLIIAPLTGEQIQLAEAGAVVAALCVSAQVTALVNGGANTGIQQGDPLMCDGAGNLVLAAINPATGAPDSGVVVAHAMGAMGVNQGPALLAVSVGGV